MWLGIRLQVKWCHSSKRIQPCELGGIHQASSAAYPEVPPMLPWLLWTFTGVPRNLKVLLPLKGMVWPHSESWGSYALPEDAWTARLQHLGTLGFISDSKYQQVCYSYMYNAYGTYTGLCTIVELNVLYYMYVPLAGAMQSHHHIVTSLRHWSCLDAIATSTKKEQSVFSYNFTESWDGDDMWTHVWNE